MIMEFKIEMVDNHNEVFQFLEDKIYEHNSSSIKKNDGRLFTFIVRDQSEHIVAGITGWVWASASEIMYLWIAEGYRAKGLGRKLLETGEHEVDKRGGKTILVRSYSFQAPAFYEKHGYQTLFVLDNFPEGFMYYTLVKRLD